MDKPLSPETQAEIRKLCESIAQRDQLGEDVQEELRGHIEDKVIGYLDGEEGMTEDDAVILVREHFGDAGTVKTLLHAAHPQRAYISLGRRIAVVFLLTFGAQLVVWYVAAALLRMISPQMTTPLGHSVCNMIVGLLFSPGAVLLVFVVLRLSRMYGGLARWLATASRARLLMLAMCMLAIWLFRSESWPISQFVTQPLPLVLWYSLLHFHGTWIYFVTLVALAASHFAIQLAGSAMLCAIWVWWCDQAPRTVSNVSAAVIAWLAFELFSVVFGRFVQIDPIVAILSWVDNGLAWKVPSYLLSPNVFELLHLFLTTCIALAIGGGYAMLRLPRQTAIGYDS